MKKTKKKENKTLKKLEAELKGIEKSSKGYSGPERELNLGLKLLYGHEGLCILTDESGRVYHVKQTLNGFVIEKMLVV